ISEIMTRDVETIAPDAPIEDIEAKFGESKVRRLLVVDPEGQLQGIVAWADLADHLPEAEVGRVVTEVVGRRRDTDGSDGSGTSMIAAPSRTGSGYAATGIGIGLLLVGAMGLFGQLQDAMNTVWEVQPKPGRGLLGLLKDRLLSMSMVMGTAFLLLTSLIVSA